MRRIFYKAFAVAVVCLLAGRTDWAQSLSYSNAIISLHPAGFWPMHEVEAPAPGDIETNYGTLGTLGNAYYGDWAAPNSGTFIHGVPGALANNSDTSVFFTGGPYDTGTAANSLFVPHTSPLATLKPPFTVECWIMATNIGTGQGDIWSQDDQRYLGIRLFYQNSPNDTINVIVYNTTNNSSALHFPELASNQWHQVVVTCDANTNMTAWADGVQGNTVNYAGKYSPAFTIPFTVGNGLGNQRGFHGLIDEVAVYTNVITDIAQHYRDGISANAGSYFHDVTNDHPVIYLRMDSPPFSAPPVSSWPVLLNYGLGGGNGVYTPGTLPGTVPGTAYHGFPSGLTGTNVTAFSGVSSFANAGLVPAFNPIGTRPFSLTAWFRGNPADTNRVQSIVGHGINSWELGLTADGRIVFNSGTNSTEPVATGSAAGDLVSTSDENDGNWHLVVAVHNGTTNILYVDGAPNNTNVLVAANNVGNLSDVLIGADPSYTNNPVGLGRQFAGQICDVAFFTKALTPAEVQTLYSTVAPYFSERLPNSVPVNENGTLIIPTTIIGAPPLSYSWTNLSTVPPTEIVGQTNATLVVSNVSSATYNNEQIQVTVTNLYGWTAATTFVTVNSGPPVIVTNLPSQVMVLTGQDYTYSICPTGTEPFHYQWFLNGEAVNGATNADFAPSSGTMGTYSVYVVITNVYNGSARGVMVSATSTLMITNALNDWVAPTASGTGDGSSSANAASYLNSSFWSKVQNQLQTADVNINLADGKYNAGTLNLNDMGNPLHQLTLQAVNLHGPVFNPTGNTIVGITGSQNIKFDGIVFTGPVQSWGVNCQPDNLNPCRDLAFSNCQFINLTNAYYGAIGLVNGTRDILVDNCTFTNLTDNNGNHQHMIYASHDVEDVVVTNCLFQDCLADYLRFRDNSEYCKVEHCTFISTMRASAWPFISSELYNDTNSDAAGDEFFGNYFQISSNSFTYKVSGGPGPYSALHFSDTGYSPYSYHCGLTSVQASQLANGTTSFQRSFLQTNMGIIASGIKMFGNTYNPQTAYHIDYTYNTGNAPGSGWSGTINLDNVPDSSGATLEPTPVLRNGNFDRQGLLLTPVTSSNLKNNECLFQTWFCAPKYTDILRVSGFDGTTSALLFDKTQNQCVYQWITPPGPTWTMDCLFAIGSGFAGSGTKFQVGIFHNDITGSKVSVGVNSSGQFGIYDGGTFTVLPKLGFVSFSTNSVYRLRIVGNYAAPTPYVNIYTSGANSPVLSHQCLDLTDWVNGAPVSGQSSPETIAFYNYTAPVIVDQVAIASGLADQPPVITNALVNDGQCILLGTNGFAGDNYYLLSSTNLASGRWTLEATNTFDKSGSFKITNLVAPGTLQKFYRLQLQ